MKDLIKKLLKRKKTSLLVFSGVFLFLMIGLFAPSSVAQAIEPVTWAVTGLLAIKLIGGVGLLIIVFSVLISAIGALFSYFTSSFLYIISIENILEVKEIYEAWILIRDICNMLFVVVLLIIAIATILHIESYSWKRLLPRLLLMAILINFSFTICTALTDISQVVLLTFVKGFSQAAEANFVQLFGIEEALSVNQPFTVAGGAIAEGWAEMGEVEGFGNNVLAFFYGIAKNLFLEFGILAIAMMIMFALWAVFTFRIIALWVLTILSPLAFAASVLPAFQKWSNEWWSDFAKYLIVGPTTAFFVWLALTLTIPTGSSLNKEVKVLVAETETDVRTSQVQQTLAAGEETDFTNFNSVVGFNPGFTQLTEFKAMLRFGFIVVMIAMGILVASKLGAAGGKYGANFVGKMQSTASKPYQFGKKLAGGRLKAMQNWGARTLDDVQVHGQQLAFGGMERWNKGNLEKRRKALAADQATPLDAKKSAERDLSVLNNLDAEQAKATELNDSIAEQEQIRDGATTSPEDKVKAETRLVILQREAEALRQKQIARKDEGKELEENILDLDKVTNPDGITEADQQDAANRKGAIDRDITSGQDDQSADDTEKTRLMNEIQEFDNTLGSDRTSEDAKKMAALNKERNQEQLKDLDIKKKKRQRTLERLVQKKQRLDRIINPKKIDEKEGEELKKSLDKAQERKKELNRFTEISEKTPDQRAKIKKEAEESLETATEKLEAIEKKHKGGIQEASEKTGKWQARRVRGGIPLRVLRKAWAARNMEVERQRHGLGEEAAQDWFHKLLSGGHLPFIEGEQTDYLARGADSKVNEITQKLRDGGITEQHKLVGRLLEEFLDDNGRVRFGKEREAEAVLGMLSSNHDINELPKNEEFTRRLLNGDRKTWEGREMQYDEFTARDMVKHIFGDNQEGARVAYKLSQIGYENADGLLYSLATQEFSDTTGKMAYRYCNDDELRDVARYYIAKRPGRAFANQARFQDFFKEFAGPSEFRTGLEFSEQGIFNLLHNGETLGKDWEFTNEETRKYFHLNLSELVNLRDLMERKGKAKETENLDYLIGAMVAGRGYYATNAASEIRQEKGNFYVKFKGMLKSSEEGREQELSTLNEDRRKGRLSAVKIIEGKEARMAHMEKMLMGGSERYYGGKAITDEEYENLNADQKKRVKTESRGSNYFGKEESLIKTNVRNELLREKISETDTQADKDRLQAQLVNSGHIDKARIARIFEKPLDEMEEIMDDLIRELPKHLNVEDLLSVQPIEFNNRIAEERRKKEKRDKKATEDYVERMKKSGVISLETVPSVPGFEELNKLNQKINETTANREAYSDWGEPRFRDLTTEFEDVLVEGLRKAGDAMTVEERKTVRELGDRAVELSKQGEVNAGEITNSLPLSKEMWENMNMVLYLFSKYLRGGTRGTPTGGGAGGGNQGGGQP